jgi:hypothetical protein
LVLIDAKSWRRKTFITKLKIFLKTIMKKTILTSALAVCFYSLGTSLAFADTIFDSISNSTIGGGETIGDGSPGGLADSFSTGVNAGFLVDVRLVLADTKPAADGDSITVGIYTDNPNNPYNFGLGAGLGDLVAPIGSISANSLTSGFASYDFQLASAVPLADNTRYWIGVSVSNSATAELAWTANFAGTGVANEYFWDFGTASNSYGPFMMSVTTSPVPVPGAVWLFGSAFAGLGFMNRRKVA